MTTTTEAVEPLVEAVRNCIETVDRWEQEDGQWIAESPVCQAMEALANIAYAGFPKDQALVDLYLAVADTAREWQQFFHGFSLNSDGEPPKSFWDAYSRMAKQLETSTQRVLAPLESVEQLWKDLAGFPRRAEQIAQMYGERKRLPGGGDRWVGPFFSGGLVDARKVEQEATQPGSVLGKDYVPPAERDRRARLATEAQEALRKLSAMKPKKREEVDVDALLYEGQFPDVIAKVSGKTETEIRRRAFELNLKINERGELQDPAEPPSKPVVSESASFEEIGSVEDTGLRPLAGNDLDQFLLNSCFTEDPDMNITDIRVKLSNANYEVSQPALRAAIKRLRG